ncbi:MAG TPA: hypothetical protein VIM28_09720 [Solirubrobacterales bacterium]
MIGVAGAHVRLDRSYGQNGYVSVQPPLPAPWQTQYIRDMAAAHDGDSFALFERQRCAGSCSSSNSLFRYLGDGSLDPDFGGSDGSYELPSEGEGIPALAVDSQGRPLIAQVSTDHAVIRRLTSSGAPDPSFGAEGTVALQCNCEYGGTRIVPGRRGMVTVVFSRGRYGQGPTGYARTGTVFTAVRLEANGSEDARFGKGGSSTFGLRGAEPFAAATTSKGGALYLGGAGCCGFDIPGYVVRVSARGRFDRRFTAATRHSLQAIRRLGSLQESINAVLVRPRGNIDLIGAAGYERGFVLRLNRSGHRHREFGHHGLRVLPVPVASAVLGSDGSTLAVSDESARGVDLLMRILEGGRLDRAFGNPGASIARSVGDFGLSVVHQVGRRALVLDRGEKECRGYCPADPKLVRFLEVSAPKRR